MIYQFSKSLLFKLDPETAHNLSFKILSNKPLISALPFGQLYLDDIYQVKSNHLTWSFPVGLAAGLDKNAEAIEFFSNLYFGAVEVGTVTPMGQVGNEKPRLFRYPEEESLRNCMGFNNHGMQVVLSNLQKIKNRKKCIGVNLGKNKITPNENAASDYCLLYQCFEKDADYLVINASSPNTPGLRDLLAKDGLEEILVAVEEVRTKTPLYLKLSPDMNEQDVIDAVDLAYKFNLSGIIATNTTIMKDRGKGGISGKLLKGRASEFRRRLMKYIQKYPELDVIGVGGIDSYQDLVEFWKQGGKLVQIYTSFIYQGPDLLRDIKKSIDKDIKKFGLRNTQELIDHFQNVE